MFTKEVWSNTHKQEILFIYLRLNIQFTGANINEYVFYFHYLSMERNLDFFQAYDFNNLMKKKKKNDAIVNSMSKP